MIIALIGFGEAGLAIASSLGRADGARPVLRAFDVKLGDDDAAIAAAKAAFPSYSQISVDERIALMENLLKIYMIRQIKVL